MSEEGERYMRLFIFFDLPVVAKRERQEYSKFRRFLIDDGYIMIQFSVYCRICKGQATVDKHLKRVKSHLPPKGSIRALQVTDAQYGRMETLIGSPKKQEKIGMDQLVLL